VAGCKRLCKTDNSYREGVVDWAKLKSSFQILNPEICYVTQGFIGSDDNNFTVTLGREGSDYSAAIFAYCLNAEAMTIWKDVPGVMTGDPRKFSDVAFFPISLMKRLLKWPITEQVLFTRKHYSHYSKKHSFLCKIFVDPTKEGTKVGASDKNQQEESYILKENQALLKISTRDFSLLQKII
jgi:aspartate kinase